MNDKFPFVLPDLGYSYNSLEPYIDEKTVKIHHDKHFKKYVDNLNDLLKKNPSLQNFSLIEMLMFQNLINEDIRKDQTTPNMIQRLNDIVERKPLISIGI